MADVGFEAFLRGQGSAPPKANLEGFFDQADGQPDTFEDFMRRHRTRPRDVVDSAKVVAVTNANGDITPELAASAARIGRQVGLPQAVVETDLSRFRSQSLAERDAAALEGNPILANWIAANEARARVASGDFANLARIEQREFTFGDALKKGAATAKLTLDFLADQLARAVGADRTETQRILRETGVFYAGLGSDPELLAAGERAKSAGGGTWYGTLLHLPGEIARAENPGQLIGKFMLEQLPPSLLGFGLGAMATAPVRSAVAAGVRNELLAAGINQGLAGAAGNTTAVVVQSLGANFNEGKAQGLSDEQATARAWTKTINEVPFNALAGAMLGLKIGKTQLTNILAQASAQGAGGGAGAVMAAHSVGEEADPVEVALEILGEGISAGPELAGLTFGQISSSRSAARAESAAATTAQQQVLSEAIKDANASELKKRDAATFREFVAEVHPDTVVYVEPKYLAGMDLSAVPQVASQVSEALDTGGDVAISIADLLAHLPGEKLLPHLRLTPDSVSTSESRLFDPVADMHDELSGPLLPQQSMTPEDWAAYMAAADESSRLAIEARDARRMRDMRWLANTKSKAVAELRAFADAQRAELEASVRAMVEAEPVYAAQRFLRTDEGKALPLDVVAERFGYASGDEMQRDIRQSEPEPMAIERMIDERLPAGLADGIALERQAEQRAADAARTRFLATEAAALANAIGSRVQLERDAQRYAVESIARRPVRAIRPAQFDAAADRAGREAAAAFRKGDTLQAARHKRNQAFQTALHAEATATTAEIERALQASRRVLQPDDGTRDGNLTATARAVLAQYGLGKPGDAPAQYLAKVERYDPELHADLLVIMEDMPPPANWRDLTVAEFRAVRDKVDALWTLARTTRQIEIDGQKLEINSVATALAERLRNEPKSKREAMVGTNQQLDLRMRLAGVRAALRRVEHWADARDRGDAGGPFRRFVWQPVSEAVTRYRSARNEHVNRFLQQLKTIEPTLKPGKIAAPELGDAMVFADRSALLHALLHTGNESNMRKLLLGYKWAEQRPDGSLDTTRWDKFLERMHAEKRITKADWDFAQATWDLLESMKPQAQAAHKRMFGYYFDEITAHPVETPFGRYAGGYVPAITDALLVPEARSHGAMDDLLAGQNSPMFPAVNRGFTKARVEQYARPLALDLRLLPAHIDKVVRFSVLGPVLRDAARLVTRNSTFREAMASVDPTAVESMLVPWLKRTATQTLNKPPESQADRAVARLANTVRHRAALILMAGNVINTLQQFTGFSVAALRVKPRYLGAALVEYLRSPVDSAAAVHGLSEWMRQRSEGGAREVDAAIEDLLTNPGVIRKAEQVGTRWGYLLQQLAQNFIDRVVWMGAYKQAAAEGGQAGRNAVRQADAAVRMTQSSFAPEDASKVEHAGAFTRLFLMFYSYFSGQANLLATEAQNAQGDAMRLAAIYLLGFAVPAFTADLIAKSMRGELGPDDPDGDELAQQLLESFALSQARYATAMVPVAGQAANAAIGQFTKQGFDDRISASPAYSAIEATVRAPRSIYRAIEGEGNPRTAVRDGLTAVSVLTGLPLGPLVRPAGHLADEETDVSVRGLISGAAPP